MFDRKIKGLQREIVLLWYASAPLQWLHDGGYELWDSFLALRPRGQTFLLYLTLKSNLIYLTIVFPNLTRMWPHLMDASAPVSSTERLPTGPQVEVNWMCHSLQLSRWCVPPFETLSFLKSPLWSEFFCEMLSATYSFSAYSPYVPVSLNMSSASFFSPLRQSHNPSAQKSIMCCFSVTFKVNHLCQDMDHEVNGIVRCQGNAMVERDWRMWEKKGFSVTTELLWQWII